MPGEAYERDARIGSVSATEWHECADPETAMAFAAHDETTGEIFIKVTVGVDVIHLRPGTAAHFGAKLLSLASDFRGCVWNIETNRCESPTCRFTPGPKHLGRREVAR